MINRNILIQSAERDDVPFPAVERDYVLAHILESIAASFDSRMVFKGGTSLRMCFFEDYRYSADLDFSLTSRSRFVAHLAPSSRLTTFNKSRSTLARFGTGTSAGLPFSGLVFWLGLSR